MFADHSIDIRTGELLGRYIAEERDSARLLRRCYEQLRRAGAPSPSPSRPMVAATSATSATAATSATSATSAT